MWGTCFHFKEKQNSITGKCGTAGLTVSVSVFFATCSATRHMVALDHFRLYPLGSFDWTLIAPTIPLWVPHAHTNTPLTHAGPHYYWKGKAP